MKSKSIAEPVWRTKDGRTIAIATMSTQHLLNTIRLLRRTYAAALLEDSLAALRYSITAPDGASMAAEQASDEYGNEAVEQKNISEQFPIIEALLQEAARRRVEELPISERNLDVIRAEIIIQDTLCQTKP